MHILNVGSGVRVTRTPNFVASMVIETWTVAAGGAHTPWSLTSVYEKMRDLPILFSGLCISDFEGRHV